MSQFDELPEGWIATTVGETIDILDRLRIPLNAQERASKQGPYSYYGANGKVDSIDEYIFDGEYTLIAEDGGYFDSLGKAVSYRVEGKFWVNNHAHIIQTLAEMSPKFLAYLFNAKNWIPYVSGTTRLKLTQASLKQVPINLPPLNEQRRIVEKIEALTTRSRKAREALEAIPNLLDQFRQSVLAAAFRGDLTADWRKQNPDVEPAEVLLGRIEEEDTLPSGWCTTSLGSIIESLKYGTSKKCSYEENGVPVLRIPNVSEGMIKHEDLKYAELTDKEIQDLSLIPGDILLIRSNGSVSLVGKTALVKESEQGFAYAGYLIRVRPNRQLVIPDYLDFCLSSYDLRTQIEVPARSTSGVHNINSKEVQKLLIPLAPLAEQKEIVRKILDFYSAVSQLESVFCDTSVEQEQLDQSILAKAFRGELVPQDPNDEPAAVLLERIRAEREKVGKKSRRGKE